MKLNYFDLGVLAGEELKWMVDKITPKLGLECRFHGFEAALHHCSQIRIRYEKNSNVRMYHKAISNKIGKIKLYGMNNSGCNIVGGIIVGSCNGSSIYSTKNNVSKDKYEMVEAIKFSDFVTENIPTFKEDFNIVKINIEGAEWDFFNDVIDNDLLKQVIKYSKSSSDYT